MLASSPRAYGNMLLTLTLVISAATAGLAQTTPPGPDSLPADTLAYFAWDGGNAEPSAFEAKIPEMISGLFGLIDEGAPPETSRIAADVAKLACAVIRGRGAFGLLDIEETTNGEPVFHCVVIVDAGQNNAQIKDTLEKISTAGGGTDKAREIKIGDAAFEVVGPESEAMQFYRGIFKDRLIFATTKKALERTIPILGGAKIATLAQNPEIVLGKKAVKSADAPTAKAAGGQTLSLFVNTKRGVEIIRNLATKSNNPPPAMFDKVVAAIGLDGFQSIYWQSNPGSRGAVSHLFIHAKPSDKGLLSLWKQRPVTDDEIAFVPQDAYWAGISHLDLTAFWNAIREAIDSIDEQAAPQVEAAIATSRQFLGFSITEDLLPALGDSWTFFDAPSHGGFFLLGTVLVLESPKPDALADILKRVTQIVAPLVADEKINLEVRTTTIAGNKISYIVLGGIPSPVALSWTTIGNRFILGLYPHSVAAAALHVDPKTRKASLLDNTEFKAGRALLSNAKPIGWGYSNNREMMKAVYPFIPLYGNMLISMASRRGVAADFGSLPTLADWLAGTYDTVGQCYTDADGIHYVSVGSATPWSMGVAPAAIGASVLLPSLTRARETARRTVCMSNLRGLGAGIHMYAADNQDKFPDSLNALIEKELVTKTMLSCPTAESEHEEDDRTNAGGHSSSYTYINGQSAGKSDVRNVLVFEQLSNHHGEGGSVLFLDGHVEFLKPPRYQEVIRETYKRLNRESEIPAEIR